MVNQPLRIKIAYRSEKEEEKEKKEKEKIPGIGRYSMGPTITEIRVLKVTEKHCVDYKKKKISSSPFRLKRFQKVVALVLAPLELGILYRGCKDAKTIIK